MSFQNRPFTATVALLCMFVGALTAAAFAQSAQPSEDSPSVLPSVNTGPLTLSKTIINTESGFLGLSSTPAAAFGAAKFVCPTTHTKGCTIRLEVSSQFWSIPVGSVAQVSVSSTRGTVNPASLVNVDGDTTGGFASVHTFQWMISGITAGSTTTVTTSFDVSSGTGSSGYRTETAELFLN